MNCRRFYARCTLLFLSIFLLTSPLFAEWTYTSIDEPQFAYFNGTADGEMLITSSQKAGLRMSQDGGATWISFNDRITTDNANFDRVEVYGASGDTIILCGRVEWPYSYQTSIRMSIDGGQTWIDALEQWNTPSFDLPGSIHFSIDPLVPTNWYMSTSSWTGVSMDAGENWTYCDFSDMSTYKPNFVADLSDPETIYVHPLIWASSGEEDCIYRSTDGGQSWSIVPFGDAISFDRIMQILVQPDGTVLVTGLDQSENYTAAIGGEHGTSWASSDFGGLDLSVYRTLFAANFESFTMLAFGQAFSPVMKSLDGGQTWVEADLGIPDANGYAGEFSFNPSSGSLFGNNYVQGAFHIPAPWDHVEWIDAPVVGGGFNVPRGIAFSDAGTLLDTWNYRLYFAEENGTDFELIHPTLVGESIYRAMDVIYFTDDLILVEFYRHNPRQVIDQELIIGLSEDLGETWVYRDVGSHKTRVRETETALELLSYSYHESVTYVSSDTGRTWTEETRLPSSTDAWEMYGDMIVATISESGLNNMIFSLDAGLTWLDPDLGPAEQYYPFGRTASFEGGVLWSDGETLFEFREDGEATTYQPGGNGPLYTWCLVPIQRDDGATAIFGVNHQDPNIFMLPEPWETWEIIDLGSVQLGQGEGPVSMAYDPIRERLWVANGAGLLWQDFILSVEGQPTTSLPSSHDLLTSWPNPFNAMTTVQITLAKPGDATVSLFDLLGREVARLHEGHLAAGQHSMELDGSDLTSGIYFLRLETPTGMVNRRVTLLK
ncbi:T9SS type A sorting domain-containing protein [bacterium]|nr:T9SS type A sorting domain-containing protein [bacterium]